MKELINSKLCFFLLLSKTSDFFIYMNVLNLLFWMNERLSHRHVWTHSDGATLKHYASRSIYSGNSLRLFYTHLFNIVFLLYENLNSGTVRIYIFIMKNLPLSLSLSTMQYPETILRSSRSSEKNVGIEWQSKRHISYLIKY